uniref:Acetylserotonin O-methyltransferase n=1 Tax=Leptobrachium leishanense TaxID=445787 RepID=A0A8C5M470_9ANUR
MFSYMRLDVCWLTHLMVYLAVFQLIKRESQSVSSEKQRENGGNMNSKSDHCETVLQETSSSDSNDIKILQDYIHGFVASKVLFTACELGIFEILAESMTPLTSKCVAEHIGASINRTTCLLNACVALKFLEKDCQNEEVCYKNTELSRLYLTKTSCKSMLRTMIHYSNEVFPAFMLLKDCVRQGVPLCRLTSESKGNDCFKHMYRSEESILQFMQFMDSSTFLFGKEESISTFDLSCFKTICDLGGCTGRLAKTCGSLYPESSIIVYDLPKIIQVACEHFTGGDSKISFQQGNFFEDPIPDADLFILSHILHDWDDEMCLKLLKKVYMACNPGGGILIIDAVLNEAEEGPAIIHLQNVVMQMICDGKERTATEFKTLLVTAGFKDIQFSTKGIITNGILARK